MVDLGLYNFVKNRIAEGKSKEEIAQDLAKSGLNTEHIDEIWEAASHNRTPVVSQKREALRTHYSTNTSLAILGILLIIIAGYFVLIEFQKHVASSAILQNASSHITMHPFSESGVGVTMDVPSSWQTDVHNAPDGAVDGFITTGQSAHNGTLRAQIVLQINTLTLTGVVAERSSAIKLDKSVHMLQDTDLTIGGQPGHIFEYTNATGIQINHFLEAYVMDAKGNLYVYTATSIDTDWSQLPAAAMVNSIAFTN